MQKKQINQQGLNLIKYFESLKLEAYQDSVGIWTIGWGHTGIKHNDGTVFEGRKITQGEAEQFLQDDLQELEKAVSNLVNVDLNDNQFSALVSFAFNLGSGNLASSTLLKLLNDKDYFNSSKEFVKWNKAGGDRLKGLVRRRLSERNLFCSFPKPIVDDIPSDWEENYLNL